MKILKYKIDTKDTKRICITSVVLVAVVSVLWGIGAAMTGAIHSVWQFVSFVIVVGIACISGAVLGAAIYVLLTKQQRGTPTGEADADRRDGSEENPGSRTSV